MNVKRTLHSFNKNRKN